MHKLIRGIIDFRKNLRPARLHTFEKLALGQHPDTLFISCSDSRVAPNWFASTDPGDLFVVRNVGNLVAPCGAEGQSTGDEAEAAALEFSILNLAIKQIIVCGHSECGAMNALSRGRENLTSPNLKSWLRHGEGSLRQLKAGNALGGHLERHNQISQLNVLEQLGHLMTYPVVQERLDKGTLKLYGWWFDIKEANVYVYEPKKGEFELIDENYVIDLPGDNIVHS